VKFGFLFMCFVFVGLVGKESGCSRSIDEEGAGAGWE
jgi:hypothetical protein